MNSLRKINSYKYYIIDIAYAEELLDVHKCYNKSNIFISIYYLLNLSFWYYKFDYIYYNDIYRSFVYFLENEPVIKYYTF